MVLDSKVVASTDGDFPFNKDQIHKLIEDATPANLVESILHKLKATSSKHKFIVTATKITSQELVGSVSCQTGTLWNEKKDGYVSLQIKEREEKEIDKEEGEGEKSTAIEQNDRVENKDGEDKKESVNEQIDEKVADILEDYQQQSPRVTEHTIEGKEPVSETLEARELANPEIQSLYNDFTKENIGGVSLELVPNASNEPIEAEVSDKTFHAKVLDADIDEAVGSIPTTEVSPSELSAHDEPVMLAAVDPEEADKIMKERDSELVADETKVSLEAPIAQSTPGSYATATETTEKKEFEPLEVAIDEHEESTVQPEAIEHEDDSKPIEREEKSEPTEDVQSQAIEHENEKSNALEEFQPVPKQPEVATTYMVTIYWVYDH